MQEINFWRTFYLFRFVICWYATPYSFANSDSVHPPFNVSNKTFVLDEDSNLLFPPSLLFFTYMQIRLYLCRCLNLMEYYNLFFTISINCFT